MNIEEIIKEKKGTIIDVRSVLEFSGGNAVGNINIPLQEIPQSLNKIEGLEQPLVFCCASGGRSGQATQFILDKGIACHNAGSWLTVNYLQSQSL